MVNSCLNCAIKMPSKVEARMDMWLAKYHSQTEEPVWLIFEGWLEIYLKESTETEEEESKFPCAKFVYLCPECAEKLMACWQENK